MNTCKSCNSKNLIEDLNIFAPYSGIENKLGIRVETNPTATIFKGIEVHNLLTIVCIDCGNVDLRIENPKKFHADYLKSKGKQA